MPAVSIGNARRVDRIVIVMVALVGIGATLWLWPRPDTVVQMGPTLPTVSAPSTVSSAISSSALPSNPPPAHSAEVRTTEAASSAAAPTSASVATSAAVATTASTPKIHSAPTPTAGTAVGSASGTKTRRLPTAVPGPAGYSGPTFPSIPESTRRTAGTTVDPAPPANRQPAATAVPGRARADDRPGVPAVITVPFPSSNHPNGVTITVVPHGINPTGEMWIPGPEEGVTDWVNTVSWLNTPGYAAPYSDHGAVILAGHINWKGTYGALSDLSEYGANDVGKTFDVSMSDGRNRTYRIVEGRTINKSQLAAEGNQGPLHTAMFGQTGRYGPIGQPTEELRLISCGGEFDSAAGSYTSNIIVIARPVT